MKKQFGLLPPKHNFSLTPYPDAKFSKCPNCHDRTGQRKLPLLIHVDPDNLIALNYTNRYCARCDLLIGHRHEIERLLTDLFGHIKPDCIGNDYVMCGTLEKEAWRENVKNSKPPGELLPRIHDFKNYQEIRMTRGGWFPDNEIPPVVEPSPSEEWVKR